VRLEQLQAMTPREFYHRLEHEYRCQGRHRPPLEQRIYGPVSEADLTAWMVFLEARFPGFTSDGCTCVPSLAAKAACQWHDLLYYVGINRRLADLELLYWIAAINYRAGWVSWVAHNAWARVYFAGVRLFGGAFYAWHRKLGHPTMPVV